MKRVLIAEDDMNIGYLTSQFLENQGYEVRLCKEGGTVMETFHQFEPNICLLDVMLPVTDGFTLGKSIRRHDPKVPIIFITAKSQLKDVLTGFESGANDYIRKPFSLEELLARITALLRFAGASGNSLQNEYSIGDYHFRYQEQLLTYGDQSWQLSPKEADLLKELCDHRHDKMDKSVTLKKLWGDDTFYNGRSMDVYISKLRKYLAQDTSVEIINLRGVGYKLMLRKA